MQGLYLEEECGKFPLVWSGHSKDTQSKQWKEVIISLQAIWYFYLSNVDVLGRH